MYVCARSHAGSELWLRVLQIYLSLLPRILLWWGLEVIPFNARLLPALFSFLTTFTPTRDSTSTSTSASASSLLSTACRVVHHTLWALATYLRTDARVRLVAAHRSKLLEALATVYAHITLAPDLSRSAVALSSSASALSEAEKQDPYSLPSLLALTTRTGVLLAQVAGPALRVRVYDPSVWGFWHASAHDCLFVVRCVARFVCSQHSSSF